MRSSECVIGLRETRNVKMRSLIVALPLIMASGCGRPSAGSSQQVESPKPQTITVCAAAKASPGAHIRVQGEFGGFSYATESLDISVGTSELCSDRGAGLVFASLAGKQERAKLMTRRPPGKRDGTPGDTVEVEGLVTKIEDGRFTHIKEAVVIR